MLSFDLELFLKIFQYVYNNSKCLPRCDVAILNEIVTAKKARIKNRSR